MAFDITVFTTASTGWFALIEAELDNLALVLPYYETMLEDTWSSDQFNFGNKMVQECETIINEIQTMTQRLENVRYGNLPCPPCVSTAVEAGGTAVPEGWGTCV